jgi:hypothetical protein
MAFDWKVFLVLGLIIFWLDWDRTRQIEKRVVAQVATASAEAQEKYVRDTAAMSQAHAKEISDLEDETERATSEALAQIDIWRIRAEKLAQANPEKFGDDFHDRLARLMCMAEAGNNREARQTCRNAPAEAFDPGFSLTVTVTQDNAEIWQEQCDDGRAEFCEWSITGFTPQGMGLFENWLVRFEGYAVILSDFADGLLAIIDKLTNPEQINEHS